MQMQCIAREWHSFGDFGLDRLRSSVLGVESNQDLTPNGTVLWHNGSMSNVNSSAQGWGTQVGVQAFETYRAAMRDADVLVPNLPNINHDELTLHSNGWLFTSDIRINSMAPYMLDAAGGIHFGKIENDFIAFGYNGHGINSYAIGLVGRIGNLVIAQQHGFGGAFGRREEKLQTVNAQTALWNELVSKGPARLLKSNNEYMIVYSEMRGHAKILIRDFDSDDSFSHPLAGWRILCDPLRNRSDRNLLVHDVGFDDPTHQAAREYLFGLLSITERGRKVLSPSRDDERTRRDVAVRQRMETPIPRSVPDEHVSVVRLVSQSQATTDEFGINHFYLLSTSQRQYVIVQERRDAYFDDVVDAAAREMADFFFERTRGRESEFISMLDGLIGEYSFHVSPMNFEAMYSFADSDDEFELEREVEMMLRQLNGTVDIQTDFEKYMVMPINPLLVELWVSQQIGGKVVLAMNFKNQLKQRETGVMYVELDRHHSLMVYPSDGLFAYFDMKSYEQLMAGERIERRVTPHLALPIIQLLHNLSHENSSEATTIWRVPSESCGNHQRISLGALDHECVFAPVTGDASEPAYVDGDVDVDILHFEDEAGNGFVSEISFCSSQGRYRFVNGRWKLQTPFEDSLMDGAYGYPVLRECVGLFLDWYRAENPTLSQLEEFVKLDDEGSSYLDLSDLQWPPSQVSDKAHDVRNVGETDACTGVRVALPDGLHLDFIPAFVYDAQNEPFHYHEYSFDISEGGQLSIYIQDFTQDDFLGYDVHTRRLVAIFPDKAFKAVDYKAYPQRPRAM